MDKNTILVLGEKQNTGCLKMMLCLKYISESLYCYMKSIQVKMLNLVKVITCLEVNLKDFVQM